jgi:hypothetical protein
MKTIVETFEILAVLGILCFAGMTSVKLFAYLIGLILENI